FLNASTDIEPFDLKIVFYIKTLERIFDHEQGSRKQRARALLDDYRKGITNQCWGHRWLTGLPDVQGYWLAWHWSNRGTGSLLGCLMFKATGWTDWIETWNDDATSDRELAKNWTMARRNGPSINILNSTVLESGTIYGGTTNGGISNIDKTFGKDLAKRTKINPNMDGKTDEFFSPVFQRDQDHENIKNNH
ncbi:1046_t:CDS:2, partial [Cetraspora pellucida]